jgi:hypothetical protein
LRGTLLFYAHRPEEQPDLRDRLMAQDRELPRNCKFMVEQGTNAAVLSVLSDSEKQPKAVMKCARHPEKNVQIRREVEALQSLNPALPGLPLPVHRGCMDGLEWLSIPFLRGTSMRLSLTALHGRPEKGAARRQAQLLDQGAGWLLNIQQTTATSPPDAEPLLQAHRLLNPAHDAFLIEALQTGRIPFTLQHGDFQPANLLLDREAVRVIDWEWAVPQGLPLIDLFNLAFEAFRLRRTLGRHRGGLPDFELLAAAFQPGGRESRWIAGWVARFRAGLDLSTAHAEALFYCWLRHKLREKTAEPLLRERIRMPGGADG